MFEKIKKGAVCGMMTQQQGLKRRREAIGTDAVRADSDSPREPSREAKAAWNDDFPANFHVLDKIGEGSFGTVWLAQKHEEGSKHQQQQHSAEGGRQEEEDDLVAIKRINPTCSPSRILNEFEQMQKLRGGAVGVCVCACRTCTAAGATYSNMSHAV